MNVRGSLPNLSRTTLGEEVYEVLRDHIFSYRYDIGERLNLDEIGRQLGISRTPLKTAVDRLALEGLLKIVPRRGTYVAAPSIETIDNAYAVREVLECYAVGQSTAQITDEQIEQLASFVREMLRISQDSEQPLVYAHYGDVDHSFHTLIVEAAGNNVLVELWQQAYAHIRVGRIRYRGRDRRVVEPTTTEHQKILAAFQARDAHQAEELVRNHILRSRGFLWEDFRAQNSS